MKPILTLAGDLSWDDYRGKNRVILMSGPVSAAKELKLQRQLWSDVKKEALERDLLLVELGTSKADATLQRRYDLPQNEFTVLLIGKDGGEKARSSLPVDLKKWLALIDTMPMRKEEMRKP